MALGETYEEFVKKFEPKRTTDDCYTPPAVMDCVNEWVAEKYKLDKKTFVRPFFPGGDYENFEYPDECVVVDNPPFSILSQITDFYAKHDIKFFLFAPATTAIASEKRTNFACVIIADADITFENGATLPIAFLTNLETDYVLKVEPDLAERLRVVCKQLAREKLKQIPKYVYPDYVVTAALCQKFAKWGVPYSVKRKDAKFIRCLDAQKAHKKTIFGGGFLLSEKAAAEKAAAEKAAAEKAAAIVWTLSDREKEIIKNLGGEEHDRASMD